MNVFDQINDAIMESSMAVYDAMLDIINKRETINDNDPSTEFDNIITESFQIFVEYVSKDKDEITKWMDKKGYFYTGDNPNKKKRTLRMYNFLKQHKFDPNDSTYESDIKTKDGKKKRLKLRVDAEGYVSDEEYKRYRALSEKINNKTASEAEKEEWAKLKDDVEAVGEIQAGQNAFHSSKDDSVSMSHKTMKTKQYHSQTTLKHEEGHADSLHRGNGSRANHNLDENHPANIALREHKAVGKYVNTHDDSTEELMADAYSAGHSQIRTKNAGKKNTRKTRPITSSEVQRALIGLTSLFDNYKAACERMVKRAKSDVEKFTKAKDALNSISVEGIKSDNIESMYESILDKCDKIGKETETFMASSSSGSISITSGSFELYDIAEFSTISDDSIVSHFKDLSHKLTGYKMFAKAFKSDDDKEIALAQRKYPEVYEDISRYGSRIINDEIEKLSKRLDRFKDPSDFYGKAVDKHRTQLKLNNYLKNADVEKAGAIVKKIVKPIIDIVDKKIKDGNKIIRNAEQALRETHELRANFAKDYVKEYFEDFIDDFIYND
jgi:hypothetical protein